MMVTFKVLVKYSLFVLFFTASFLLSGCNENVAGGTEIDNPEKPKVLSGRLVYEDGTPATGAKISIRPADTLADTTGLAKIVADTATTTTDDSGYYAIDTGSLDTGIYVFEGDDGQNNMVLIDSVVINDPDSCVELGQDTLKPSGTITGVINLSLGGDMNKVFILAYGMDRLCQPDINGVFTFEKLAGGSYDLKFITSYDVYTPFDTNGVTVISGESTNLNENKIYPHSMKGWGLVTWKDSAKLYFTLIVSTNRVQTLEEYISDVDIPPYKTKVEGMDSAKTLLSQLPPGETIGIGGNPYPKPYPEGIADVDSSIIIELRLFCEQSGLNVMQ